MSTSQPDPGELTLTVAELNAEAATNAAIGIHEAHKGHAPPDLPWDMIRDEDPVRHMADTLHLAASKRLGNVKRLVQEALDLYLKETQAEFTQALTGKPIRCLKCGTAPKQRLHRWFILCPACDPKTD
jgi:hypothetical protein